MDSRNTPSGADVWGDAMFEDSPFGSSAFDNFTNMDDYDDNTGGLMLRTPSKPGHEAQRSMPMASSASAETSSQDSSSDTSSRRKRKTTSESPVSDLLMDGRGVKKEDSILEMRKSGQVPQYTNAMHARHAGVMDQKMLDTNVFDFNSAASSPINPGAFDAALSLDEQVMAMPVSSAYNQESPVQTINPATFSLGGSRDQSPATNNMIFNNTSPHAIFSTPSSDSNDTFNPAQNWGNGMVQNPAWPADFTQQQQFASPSALQFTPSPSVGNGVAPGAASRTAVPTAGRSRLHIAPISTKSRVETQINVIMTLEKPPPAIEYLHLPLHTIAKSKLLAKEEVDKTKALELHTMLVCTSAMRNPQLKEKALQRAAAQDNTEIQNRAESQRDQAEEDKNDPKNIPEEDRPSNGGEVRICNNCIQRERKRAGRKKLKKEEEQQHWERYETERVVVFNSNEYLSFKVSDPAQAQRDIGTSGDDYVPPAGSIQVTAAMRIACYCRHQSEKEGFQVIFTLKDEENNLIAQEISDSILITDDHKTHPPSFSAQMPDQMMYGAPLYTAPSHGLQTSYSMVDMASHVQPGFASSRSTGNLQGLAFNQQFNPQSHVHQLANAGFNSQTTSATMTPTTSLSRPGSPTSAGTSGPNKKRKSSSFHRKVPSGLTMTPRMDTSQQTMQNLPSGMTMNSPFSPTSGSGFNMPAEQPYMTIPNNNGPAQFISSGPSTPIENNAQFQFSQPPLNRNNSQPIPDYYQSLPGSRVGSRAPSPVLATSRPNLAAYARQQMAPANAQPRQQPVYPPTSNVATSSTPENDPTSLPMIHKLTPIEGPTAGGTEVSIYGRNFMQGMQVFFGEQAATAITFYGEQSLLCTTPPGRLGAVHVTLLPPGSTAYSPSQMQQRPIFTYKNSHERMMELALRFVSQQQMGNPNAWYQLAQQSASKYVSQNVARAGLNQGGFDAGNNMLASEPAMLEDLLLRILDSVDMSESPEPPNFDFFSDKGETMLTLAASIGLHRAVAALLARGASPDVRDASGFTPLMHAALQNQQRIFRLLILRGADPTIRSLSGVRCLPLAPAESRSAFDQILLSTPRTRNGRPSLQTRTSVGSFASSKASWDISSASLYESEEGSEHVSPSRPVSRRPSGQSTLLPTPEEPDAGAVIDSSNQTPPQLPAAMSAWRDALAAQIQQFQQNMQNMHRSMPNFQVPLPPLPTLEECQDNAMRRLSSLVPGRVPWENMFSQWPAMPDQLRSASATPPPAYSDLFPEKKGSIADHKDGKAAGSQEALLDAVADRKCVAMFDQDAQSSGTLSTPATADESSSSVFLKSANLAMGLSTLLLMSVLIALAAAIMHAMMPHFAVSVSNRALDILHAHEVMAG